MSNLLETFVTAQELTGCVPQTISVVFGIECQGQDVFALAMIATSEIYPMPLATVMTFEKPGVDLAKELALGIIHKAVESGLRVPVAMDAFASVSLQHRLSKAGAEVMPLQLTEHVVDVAARELRSCIQGRTLLIADDDKLRKAFSRTLLYVNDLDLIRPVKRDIGDNIDPVYALLYAMAAHMRSASW